MFGIGQWIENQYLVLERYRGRRWILYIAQDRISENVFAIKGPSEALYPKAFASEQFKNKARIWANLGECDEIVKAYMVKEFEGTPYLFIEYIDGPSLADILCSRPGKPLPISQTIALMEQLIRGMKFLHKASFSEKNGGGIHGNLTPQNILTSSGSIKITDIGLANAFRSTAGIMNTELFHGRICYMAPEKLESPDTEDKLSDIYSFGAVMYEVATGTPPTMANEPEEDPLAHFVGSGPVSPRMRNRLCPRWLEETILKCMARDPDNRFQSFEHIEKLVSEVLTIEEAPDAPEEKHRDSTGASRVARVRGMAKKESRQINHYYLGVEHLMLGLIAEEESIVVSALGDKVSAETLRSEILSQLPKGEGQWYWEGIRKTPRYKRIMKLARRIRLEYADSRMLPQHILLAILQEGQNVPVRVLQQLSIDVESTVKKLRHEIGSRRPAIFVTDSDTPAARCTSKVVCATDVPCSSPFVGRRSELEKTRELLLDDRKSIMLVGEPGVGKTAFVHELECLISEAAAGAGYNYGGLFKLRTAVLIASAEEEEHVVSNFVSTIDGIIDSSSILMIEDLPVLLSLTVRVSPKIVANLLEEYIAFKGLAMVGTTTPSGYALCESEYENLTAHLEVVNLREPSDEETLQMLMAAKETFEIEHSVSIADEALPAVLDHSRTTPGRSLPGSAFELLEKTCVTARLCSYASDPPAYPVIITAEQVETALNEASEDAEEWI